MAGFLTRRLLQSLLTLLGVLTATFFLVRLAGDPTTLLLPVEATPDEIATFRTALGLDRPLPVQYVKFLTHGAVHSQLGRFYRAGNPDTDALLARLKAALDPDHRINPGVLGIPGAAEKNG